MREDRSRAHCKSKVVRLVSTTTYKQQKSWLYHCHMSEIQSFEDSELTFSVDRRHGEPSKWPGLFVDLLFVHVIPRHFRSL